MSINKIQSFLIHFSIPNNSPQNIQKDRAERISDVLLGWMRGAFGREIMIRPIYSESLEFGRDDVHKVIKVFLATLFVILFPISLLLTGFGLIVFRAEKSHSFKNRLYITQSTTLQATNVNFIESIPPPSTIEHSSFSGLDPTPFMEQFEAYAKSPGAPSTLNEIKKNTIIKCIQEICSQSKQVIKAIEGLKKNSHKCKAQKTQSSSLSFSKPEIKFSITKINNHSFVNIPKSQLINGGDKTFHLALDLLNKSLVAVTKRRKDQTVDVFVGDRIIFKHFNAHPSLVSYFGFLDYENQMKIPRSIAYMKLYRGHVHDVIHKSPQPLKLEYTLSFAYSLAQAIQVLHGSRLTHNDIKPLNIFFNPDNKTVVLGDFGCLQDWRKDFQSKQLSASGSISTVAPERFRKKSFTFEEHCKGDVYSFGTILYHLLKGKELPYHDVSIYNQEVLLFNLQSSTDYALKEEIDEELSKIKNDITHPIYAFCASLLDYNFSYRPSIDEVVTKLKSWMV